MPRAKDANLDRATISIDCEGRGQHADLERAADPQLAVPTDQPGRLRSLARQFLAIVFARHRVGGIGLLARRITRREFRHRIPFLACVELAQDLEVERDLLRLWFEWALLDRALGVEQRPLEVTSLVVFARVIEEEMAGGRWGCAGDEESADRPGERREGA